jgi:hypothetical protein
VFSSAQPIQVLANVRSTGKAESKKPIGERALGLVAAYKSALTGSCSFDEARSPMGLRVAFQRTTTGYQSVDGLDYT